MGSVTDKGEYVIPSEARNLALAQEDGEFHLRAVPCSLFPVP
jgi:hypothetical protein